MACSRAGSCSATSSPEPASLTQLTVLAGVLAALVQLMGLVRWPFVVGELARQHAQAAPRTARREAGLHHLQLTYADDDALQPALDALDGTGTAVRRIDGRPGRRVVDPSGNALQLLGPPK